MTREKIGQEKGFTLLEMLLVLGLVAGLMLALTQLLSHTASVWSDSNESIQTIENDEIAINFIRKMLTRARPIDWKSNEEGRVTKTLVGLNDKLYFAAPLPITGAEQLGLYLFAIHVEKTDTQVNKALVVSYWALNEESLDETLAGEKYSDVIMTDVDSVSFRYFGDRDYRDGLRTPIWHDDWEAVKDFPLAVQMSLTRTPTDPDDETAIPRITWKDLTFTILQRSIR